MLKVNMSMNSACPRKIATCRHTIPCNIPLFNYWSIAWAVRGDFELADADAPIAAGICRRLDGIPLAMQTTVDIFGLSEATCSTSD